MEIRQLRNFVAIVDGGSLSKAAGAVYVTQPALSRQLAGLEHELKTQLLSRSPQGVVPTEAGLALYRHARAILRQIEQARLELAYPGGGELGSVAVGIPSTIVLLLAGPLLKRVREQHPGIRLHLFEGMSAYLAELLESGRLDLAIQFRGTDTPGIEVRPLLEEDLYVMGTLPNTSPHDSVCPAGALDGVPMVLATNSQALRILIERTFAQKNLKLNVIADIDSFRAALEVARAGIACTILPYSALMPSGRREGVIARRLVEPEIRRPLSLAWSTSFPKTPAAEVVQRFLAELARELVTDQLWTGARLYPAHAPSEPR